MSGKVEYLLPQDEDNVKPKNNERKFMMVPADVREQIKSTKGRKIPSKCYILEEKLSDEKCPYGKGHKIYYLEHEIICINIGEKFAWLSK